MLLAILREIDVRAYPLLISTRGNGNAYSPFPILADFSYAAIAVEIEGAFFIFDVSDKFKPPSLLNYSALNKYGLVVRKEGFSWVALNTDMSTDIFLGKFTIDENELRGKFSTKHTNYSAYYERDYTRDDDFLDHWKLAFQKKFPRTYIYDGSHENLENINDEFRQDFSIDIPSAVNFKEDTITVTPYLYGMYDVSPFQLTKRGYEVDFAYPFSEQYIFRLDIPDGYTVSKMPTKVTKSKCNGTASLLIDPSTINNQIQIIKKLHVKKVIYSQEEASEIMELFQQIEDETQAKIVLVKTMKG